MRITPNFLAGPGRTLKFTKGSSSRLSSTSYASCKRQKTKARRGAQTCPNRTVTMPLTTANSKKENEHPPRAELSLAPVSAFWDSYVGDKQPKQPGGPEEEGSSLTYHSLQKPAWVTQHCLCSPSSLVSKQTHIPSTFHKITMAPSPAPSSLPSSPPHTSSDSHFNQISSAQKWEQPRDPAWCRMAQCTTSHHAPSTS